MRITEHKCNCSHQMMPITDYSDVSTLYQPTWEDSGVFTIVYRINPDGSTAIVDLDLNLHVVDCKPQREVYDLPKLIDGWYKVRYNTSGEYGYVSNSFLNPTAYTYGKVYLLPSIALRSTKNTSGQLVCYVNYGEAMPYNTLSTVSGVQWAHCVRGRYPGWADTGFNASFQYED